MVRGFFTIYKNSKEYYQKQYEIQFYIEKYCMPQKGNMGLWDQET